MYLSENLSYFDLYILENKRIMQAVVDVMKDKRTNRWCLVSKQSKLRMQMRELFKTMEGNTTVLGRVLMEVNIADELWERNSVLERAVNRITQVVDKYQKIQEINSMLTQLSQDLFEVNSRKLAQQRWMEAIDEFFLRWKKTLDKHCLDKQFQNKGVSVKTCWHVLHQICKVMAVKMLPSDIVKTMFTPCSDFKQKLITESGLMQGTVDRLLLQCVLNKLTFLKNDFFVDDGSRNALPAIVAGSFPAKLANTIRTNRDVDVFVVVTSQDFHILETIWWIFDRPFDAGVYERIFKTRLLAVRDFGRVQVIVKWYEETCLCDEHIDHHFFKDFHHVTRWKLDVYADNFVPRYIYHSTGMIAKETAIDSMLVQAVVRDANTGHFEVISMPSYPQKHIKNVLDHGPPSLAEQSLHAYLRNKCMF